MKDCRLRHYASDLFPELEMDDEIAFNESLIRARQVCSTLHIPLNDHFKKVYRFSHGNVYCDYKLSNTAYILVSINGDVSRKNVARIQVELIRKLLGSL